MLVSQGRDMPAQANAKAPLGTPVRHAFGQPVRLWVYVFAVLIAGWRGVRTVALRSCGIGRQCPGDPMVGIFLLATAAELGA